VSRKSLRWLLPAAALPILALLAYGFRVNHRDIPSPLVNRPAAPFVLTSYAGEPMSLEANKGRVVVVNFWASWCMPACYEEAPVLERNWRTYKDKGVVVLGVNIQDKPEAARKFIDQFSLTFPNALDPAGKVSIDYGVYGVPETFFIDARGRIRAKHAGAVTDTVFQREVDRLLAEPR
jgi:cytochrome c biogenesis protein CcmG/thiol:disulfide interchange protein DsbE